MTDVMPCGCTSDAETEGTYQRVCDYCGTRWPGSQCPHDSYQPPCPECDVLPQPQFAAGSASAGSNGDAAI